MTNVASLLSLSVFIAPGCSAVESTPNGSAVGVRADDKPAAANVAAPAEPGAAAAPEPEDAEEERGRALVGTTPALRLRDREGSSGGNRGAKKHGLWPRAGQAAQRCPCVSQLLPEGLPKALAARDQSCASQP